MAGPAVACEAGGDDGGGAGGPEAEQGARRCAEVLAELGGVELVAPCVNVIFDLVAVGVVLERAAGLAEVAVALGDGPALHRDRSGGGERVGEVELAVAL